MSSFSWRLPAPPTAPAVSPSGGIAATKPSELRGLLDLAIDPLSRDFIDADDGGLVETTDSRTAVLFQMECDLNAWWADHTQGSRIRAIIRGDDSGGDVLALVDEVKRCLQPLVADGIISELDVVLDEDETGRPAVVINYLDSTTGHPVDIAYVPFNL